MKYRNLPEHLWVWIFCKLGCRDLVNVCLVSKRMCFYARVVLYKKITLDMEPEKLFKLTEQIISPKFRHHVRSLVWIPDTCFFQEFTLLRRLLLSLPCLNNLEVNLKTTAKWTCRSGTRSRHKIIGISQSICSLSNLTCLSLCNMDIRILSCVLPLVVKLKISQMSLENAGLLDKSSFQISSVFPNVTNLDIVNYDFGLFSIEDCKHICRLSVESKQAQRKQLLVREPLFATKLKHLSLNANKTPSMFCIQQLLLSAVNLHTLECKLGRIDYIQLADMIQKAPESIQYFSISLGCILPSEMLAIISFFPNLKQLHFRGCVLGIIYARIININITGSFQEIISELDKEFANSAQDLEIWI